MSSAREIANQRFARGEISEEEYLSIIARLDAGATPSTNAALSANASAQSFISQPTSVPEVVVETAAVAPAMLPHMTHHYANATRRSKLKFVAGAVDHLASATMFMYAISLFALYRTRENLPSMNNWLGIFSGEIVGTTSESLLFLVFFLPEVLLAIFGLVWVYRASKNLFYSKVANLNYSPAWSVGWFFIPVASIWKPIQVMHQIYAGTHNADQWQSQPSNKSIALWWGLFWVSVLVSKIIPVGIQNASEVNGTLLIYGLYCAVSIASVAIFSDLVKTMTAKQEQMLDQHSV